jgi:hypothetical protein
MAFTIIRIRAASHQSLKEIADASGQSLQDALDQAIEERRRILYLEGVSADYAALSPKVLADLKKEVGMWDVTSLDGLEDQ